MVQQQVFAPGAGSGNDDDQNSTRSQIQVQSIDMLLDQIDSVLESDAQTFVDGFVQKGGQ
ncbi:MAG: ubiquitin-like protein Pup [Actinomycetaceae bacterium]|nr:ubiquitin-like protein Pup [Actinomycetaceae bacterium]